jgi:hypothetical protein
LNPKKKDAKKGGPPPPISAPESATIYIARVYPPWKTLIIKKLRELWTVYSSLNLYTFSKILKSAAVLEETMAPRIREKK